MRQTALILLCLALSAGQSIAEDRALLIGIGEYRIKEANLPGVGEDLIMMREVARTLGYADAQIKTIADSAATLQGIRNAIDDWLVAGTSADDRVLFYHSGHGTRIPDAPGGDEKDGSDEALLPFDFIEVPTQGGDKRLSNVLLDDELGRLLARIPAREVVALVDSCHSGTMTRSLGGRWRSKFYSYRGIPRPSTDRSLGHRALRRHDKVVLLSAASPEEDAQTSSRGALFTQGVWKTVRAAKSRQQLTLEQLQRATERFIQQEVGQRKEFLHRPMLTGHRDLRSINLFLPPDRPEVAATATDTTTVAPTAISATATNSGQTTPPVTHAPSGATVSAQGQDLPSFEAASDLWNQLEVLVRDAGQILDVTANKATYSVGESLELSVIAPSDGYLHILNVGDGEDKLVVLYPNLHQTDHHVLRGQTVHIPAPRKGANATFTLPAQLPSDRIRQKNLVVAIQTSKPLFLGTRTPRDAQELFRVIRAGEFTRSITRQPLVATAYAAGHVVVTIGL